MPVGVRGWDKALSRGRTFGEVDLCDSEEMGIGEAALCGLLQSKKKKKTRGLDLEEKREG